LAIGVFVATRPDIIKLTPVIRRMKEESLPFVLIHTGQHYDANMSDNFFGELKLPQPDSFLGAKPETASDVSDLIPRITNFLKKNPLDAVTVLGDTNSAMTVAVSACVLFLPVIHIEAGCRSFDRRMPEEINRVLIADCADLHFAPTRQCLKNLIEEKVPGEALFSGHPVVELVEELKPRIERLGRPQGLDQEFVILTLHRPENSDDKEKLGFILRSFGRIQMPVIFPVHPRTQKNLKLFGLYDKVPKNVQLVEPLGYLEMLRHIRYAHFVATDSGGVQQEAFLLGTPCLTIRRTFDWPETLEAGINFLANPEMPGFEDTIVAIANAADSIRMRFKNVENIFGGTNASKIIVDKIKQQQFFRDSSL
jgi:UDP-N-acetylglucosamine 2-epimerase